MNMESNTVVTRLLELARRDPKYLEDIESFRRVIVVMFTDIHGSTAYFEKHGDVAGLLLVHECNGMIRRVVEKHGGRLIKTIGDGSMATFDDCARAVAGAVEMQTTLADMNTLRRPEEQAAIRIGVHYGTGIVKSNDVFGDVVNMASRVESVAVPGQIVVSDELYEQIKSLGFRTAELGWFSLKGKTGERRLLEVLWKKDTTKVPAASGGASKQSEEAGAPPAYKLQVVRKDGEPGAEYPLKSTLTIGRSEGDIRFPSDPNMSARHAQIMVIEGQVFVEDVSRSGDSVFVRLSAAYTLQDEDIIVMGNQVFRFHENSAAMTVAATLGATLSDLSSVLDDSVAEFVHLDSAGNPGKQYPLRREAVDFGRNKGIYTFPDDKLMSRLHARVLQRGEDFVIEDAGSRNGTFIRVRGRASVPVGSAVLVGSRLLKLVESS
jgi:adenylate cyclase